MSDLELWHKVRNNSEEAFKELFYRYHPLLINLAFTYLRDENTAKDLAQNVFVNIWQKRKELNIRDDCKAYLLRAMRNHCINYLKKKKSVFLDDSFQPPDPSADGQDRLHLEDLNKRVQLAITKMPEACRMIFLLRRREDLSLKEIAQQMEISTKTVENQLTKAHKILKEYLKPVLVAIYLLLCWL